jgi:hypothetical protein
MTNDRSMNVAVCADEPRRRLNSSGSRSSVNGSRQTPMAIPGSAMYRQTTERIAQLERAIAFGLGLARQCAGY